MSKTIAEITKIIMEFADERGWKNEDPNQLISSILIEMGELAEHYQWQKDFSRLNAEKMTPQKLTEIGYEFVDVIFYLFRLAGRTGIDIEAAFDSKLPKLEQKFPPGKTSKYYQNNHKKYRVSGKNKLYE